LGRKAVSGATQKTTPQLPQAIAILAPAAVEVRQQVAAWLERLLGPGADEYAVVRLHASSAAPEDLEPHLAGLSLLAEQRVVVIEQVADWAPTQQRQLLQMLRNLPPGVSLILTVVGEQASLRQPLLGELMQYLDRHGRVERRAKPKVWDLPEWAQSFAQRLGVTLSPPAAAELVGRVGPDQDRLASELEKLATYVGPGKQITPEAVRTLVPRTAEGSVFELLDAIGAGQAAQAAQLVREYLPPSGQEEATAQLIYQLARHLRLLWQARVLTRAGYNLTRLEEVPEEWVGKLPADSNVVAAVHDKPWMARRLADQARRHTDASMLLALRSVYVADLTLKGQLERRLPPEIIAELLVSELCRVHEQASRGR
jgi:DNA polymerase III delta subunit